MNIPSSVVENEFLMDCQRYLMIFEHTRVLAKKYGWSVEDIRHHYKTNNYTSLVLFELKVLRVKMRDKKRDRRLLYYFLKYFYYKGYCNYYHKEIYYLDRCNTCSACNWTWKCQHWERRWR